MKNLKQQNQEKDMTKKIVVRKSSAIENRSKMLFVGQISLQSLSLLYDNVIELIKHLLQQHDGIKNGESSVTQSDETKKKLK